MGYGQNMASSQPNQKSSETSKVSSSHQTINQNEPNRFTRKYSFCSDEHYFARLVEFKAQSLAERQEFINSKKPYVKIF